MNRYIKVLIATISLTLCGCTQSHNKATLVSNPLKDSIAINTFMDFRLGSSRNETENIIDSLLTNKLIKDYQPHKTFRSNMSNWAYSAAHIERMDSYASFTGTIILKSKGGNYVEYDADCELQYFRDTLYSVLVYPGDMYFDNARDDLFVYEIFSNKYSHHYTPNTYGPIELYDEYDLDGVYAYTSPDWIRKYTSYVANSNIWEFKTSTIGLSTLTYHYTCWDFDPNSYMRAIKNSCYANMLDDMSDYDYARLAEEIISRAIVRNRENDSSDELYFWYRNDIIQEQLDNIKAEKEEKLRQYQIEQQNKCKEESNKLQEQFQKQAI